MSRALVGLKDVEVVGVIGWTVPLQVHIASMLPRPSCLSCGTSARVKQTMRRRLGCGRSLELTLPHGRV